MSKCTKIWLICAIALIIAGTIIFTGVMFMFGWDFTKLSTVKYETNEHEITGNFNNIDISTLTSDIIFLPSKNAKTSVICYEQKKIQHSVEVRDDTLTIKINDTLKWYEYIGIISFKTPEITVYLPEAEYSSLTVKGSTGDVKIPDFLNFETIDVKLSTGDVSIESITAKSLDISVSTGDIELENINAEDIRLNVSTGDVEVDNTRCNTLLSKATTGDLTLENTIAKSLLSIESDTGDVEFDGCDAEEILITTDTGHVKGTLLSDKMFITSTDTGKVNVPKSTTGGKCKITTDTGDIRIKVKALH